MNDKVARGLSSLLTRYICSLTMITQWSIWVARKLMDFSYDLSIRPTHHDPEYYMYMYVVDVDRPCQHSSNQLEFTEGFIDHLDVDMKCFY